MINKKPLPPGTRNLTNHLLQPRNPSANNEQSTNNFPKIYQPNTNNLTSKTKHRITNICCLRSPTKLPESLSTQSGRPSTKQLDHSQLRNWQSILLYFEKKHTLKCNKDKKTFTNFKEVQITECTKSDYKS